MHEKKNYLHLYTANIAPTLKVTLEETLSHIQVSIIFYFQFAIIIVSYIYIWSAISSEIM